MFVPNRKSRKSVVRLFERDYAGPVPIDYLADPGTDEKLKRYYDVATESELLDVLGSDFYYLSCRDISQNESLSSIYNGTKLDETDTRRTCPFGIGWTRGAYKSKFAVDEAVSHPLAAATGERDILDYSWPKVEDFKFDAFGEEIEQNQNRMIVGGFWSGILGDAYRMHGFENFLLNIAVKPEMIKTLVNRMTDFYLALNAKLFEQFGDKIDIWFFGNDFGSQNGLLFSPAMIEEFFIGNFKRLCDLAHSYGIKKMMHSCGAITEIIPMIIDAGVDILDPIQVTAANMSPAAMKEKFGGKLIFHGGIDTQHVLPHQTPDQVERHCLDTLHSFQGCGYIFAPSQILQKDIPAENIDRMYKTVNHYNQSLTTSNCTH